MGLRALAVIAALLAAVGGASTLSAKPKPPKAEKKAVAGELVVRFAAGVSDSERKKLLADAGVTEKANVEKLKIKVGKTDAGQVERAIKVLESDARVLYAEPNFVVRADRLPDDPSFTQLWGLDNTGQTVDGAAGTADADIDAPEAWEVTTGNPGVVVGVIDTGVDFSHPDLAGTSWINPGEDCTGCRTNGVDDDGNGYVDDWRGWDFINNDNNPFDDEGHGTHVAGTIGASGSNGVGITGVAWDVRIAGLKFLGADGYGDTADALKAILYAADKGFALTNNSWGGGERSQALADAIAEADRKGTLVVAAAGNNGTSNDGGGHYPSNYESPNVVAVAATNSTDALAWFSNYGATTVDLGAPGENIYSTIPGASYAFYDGTSMATPHVSGALALAKAAFPSATGAGLKALVLRTVDPVSALSSITTSRGRLNVNAMVRCAAKPQAWIEQPLPGFKAAVGEKVQVVALGAACGSPTATVTATVNGTPFTLTNRGDGLYTGTFSAAAPGAVDVAVSAAAGGLTDTRTVSGEAEDNYRFEQEAFSWIDATLGTRTSIASDDASATVSLPFSFTFYKQPFTSLKISSNGFLVFGASAATAYSNAGIPNSTEPNGMVAPYWDDLNPGAGGSIWYRTTGTAPNRKFTVAWIGVPHFSYGDITLQVTLEETTNDIVYSYKDVLHGNANADYGMSATVGVENAAGTIGRQFLFKEPKLQGFENTTSIRVTSRAQVDPDTTAPAAPAGLAATGGTRQVVLDWADNAEPDLAGYRVYRNGVQIASPTGSAFTDTGLADGATYTYEVTAVDNAGNESARSAQASATTAPPDTTPPAPPGSLTATGGTQQVALDWADNGEGDLVGYRVYRDGALIASPTASAYTDTGLADGTTYTYEVAAIDTAGNVSPRSAAVSATTDARAPIAKTYQPNGYTVVVGSVYKNRGGLSRLYSNDGTRQEISSALSAGRYEATTEVRTTISGAELATLRRVQVEWEGYATSSAATLTVSVYDFARGVWVQVAGPVTGVTSDRLLSWSTTTAPANYVSSTGEIRMRITGTRSGSFRTLTDLVRFSIEY